MWQVSPLCILPKLPGRWWVIRKIQHPIWRHLTTWRILCVGSWCPEEGHRNPGCQIGRHKRTKYGNGEDEHPGTGLTFYLQPLKSHDWFKHSIANIYEYEQKKEYPKTVVYTLLWYVNFLRLHITSAMV